ncbi:MAG: hypothetical protein WDN31_07300 [Hyphomicrobium sp.]
MNTARAISAQATSFSVGATAPVTPPVKSLPICFLIFSSRAAFTISGGGTKLAGGFMSKRM